MSTVNDVESVKAHYGRGDLEGPLLARVRAAGKDPEHFHPTDLGETDQLHIGGSAATHRLAVGAGISGSSRVLEIGSGIGGVARYLAGEFGATVHGVDVTPEFVAVAESLTRRTGLDSLVHFSVAPAAELPLEDASFDVAVLIHVGMNIRRKDQVFAEAARVLRPGGVLAVYDIMDFGEGEAAYPLPWASHPDMSFTEPPLAYTRMLEQAGFEVDAESKHLEDGIAFLERALESGAPAGVMTSALANLLAAFRAGFMAPVEIYAHRP